MDTLPIFGQSFGSALAGQTLINAGGPAVGAYAADEFFLGGAPWGPANDPAMGGMVDQFQTLRYGTNFTYTIPISTPGLYSVAVLLTEPNKTGPGQRTFTVTANGQQTPALDLYALTGGKLKPYEVDFWFVAQSQVTISFNAIFGNAVCSAIVMLPPPATASLWLESQRAFLAGLMTPFGPPIRVRARQ